MPITINTVTQLTGAIVKTLYEGESNTNAFTDAEKTKLGSLSVLSTVSQAAAEAGTSTNVYNWTPQRVAQAIAALAGAAAVASVNGNTGTVVLDATDIDVVDSGGNFTATTIEAVLAEIYTANRKNEVALSSGNFTARIGYIGATAPSISTGGAGDYTITIPSGTMFLWGNLFANNTTINGSNELEVNIDNSANSANRWFSAQILDANNGGLVDAHALSVNYTQTITSNVTTILFPSFNINGANGFRIMLS